MCAYLMYVSMLETFDANRKPCASFGLMEVGSHVEAGRLCGLLVNMVKLSKGSELFVKTPGFGFLPVCLQHSILLLWSGEEWSVVSSGGPLPAAWLLHG